MGRLLLQLGELKKYGEIKTPGARAVEVAHRRWGKDDVALHFTACASHLRVGNYWHMLPKYEQCRKAIWDAINPRTGKKRIDEAFPESIRRKTNQQEMKIEFNCGSIWQLVGSDNYNSYVGSPPIGVVFSEWALANPLAWSLGIRPIIEENGGWVLWIYTPRGDNHGKSIIEFAETEKDWFAQRIDASQTNVFTKDQMERILREMIAEIKDEDEARSIWMQEYFCSFDGAVRGSYYSKQMAAAEEEGRIARVPWQPAIEVDTYWDLGVDDSMAIWFIQHVGKAHHVIDYYENTGMGMGHYAGILKDKKYNYAEHVMPHDAEARELTAGELAKSPRELAEDAGLRPITVVPRAQNMELIIKSHIPAVRNILPSCWFDREKCAIGISALKSYHAEYDEDRKKPGNRPEHDWASHGADAFRTFAVGYAPPKPKDESVTDMMAKFRSSNY